MRSLQCALVGLAFTAALAGCGLEVGRRTGGPEVGPSAASPTPPVETAPTTGTELPDRTPASVHAHARLHIGQLQLSAARDDARTFFTSYVAYLYGRAPVRRVIHLSPRLRQQLDSDRAEVTPAERAARTRITWLSVAIRRDTTTVVAIATVRTRGETLQLTATLQSSGSSWHVVAVAG
jgi:hypothetical protein